jgi:hypothetical protein
MGRTVFVKLTDCPCSDTAVAMRAAQRIRPA